MSKAPKQDARCILCDWKLKGTNKYIDGIKCPECDGPVVTEVVNKCLTQTNCRGN